MWKNEIADRTWSRQIGTIRVVVTRHINYDPDQWHLKCSHLGILLETLRSKDIEDAKREAMVFLKMRAAELIGMLEGVE